MVAVAVRLGDAGIAWQLAGSGGRLLLGTDVRPGDVDVEVALDDGPAASRALGLPPPVRGAGGAWSSWRTGGAIAQVPIDLSAGLEVRGNGYVPGTSPSGDAGTDGYVPGTAPSGVLMAMDARRVPVRVGSVEVPVIVPGESLARALLSGDEARIVKSRTALPPDGPARDAALAYCESRLAEAAASAAR